MGAIGNLTTEEYAARQPNAGGGCQITVHQHKTAAQGVAVLFATSELAGLLQEYSTVVRPALKPTSNNFFCMPGGGIVTKLSARLAVLGKACGLKLPAAGVHRKTVVTLATEKCEKEREHLADLMCHSLATAKRHYDARAKNMEQGFKVAQSILEGGVTKDVKDDKDKQRRRRPYTTVQTELIETFFADQITNKKQPTTMEAQEFLDLHTTFTDRTTKDIVDKVRTIIRRNK